MGQNETLGGSSDRVLFEWRDGGRFWRVHIVAGNPKLETLIREGWYMVALKPETAALLHIYVSCFVFGLKVQEDRARAEVRAAVAEGDGGRAGRWGKVVRRVRNEIDALPEPYRSMGRKGR